MLFRSCEYMTGGCTVVLGQTGRNFAAGMSGGVAYVLDEDNTLYKKLNKELVTMDTIDNRQDEEELSGMIEAHVNATGSKKGATILKEFDRYLPKFKKIIPNDYKRMILLTAKYEAKGLDSEHAQVEAFNESLINGEV